jgi:hypothetical protein
MKKEHTASTETKHTPGPWSAMPFWGDSITGNKGIVIYGPIGNDKRIAEIQFTGFRGELEHEANAALIVEAVNAYATLKAHNAALLAALEALIDSASWTPTDNWRIGPMDSSKGGKMDMARAAIAQAKGAK